MTEFIVGIVKDIMFEKMDASDFCGCYEGDVDHIYEHGVELLLEKIREEIVLRSKDYVCNI